MSNKSPEHDAALILAAEECPPDSFEKYHKFTPFDDAVVRKLSAHGPILIRGGRGSGKSALLIAALRRMRNQPTTFPVYVSLRYLPLLRSDGDEYINHFCEILSNEIKKEIDFQSISHEFAPARDQVGIQIGLTNLALDIGKRIVLLFDDAAHIGREKPLEVFFDLFRTLSSNLISCKASIYPGVTKFGVRFDVYNDSTVIDISRSNINTDNNFFYDVLTARYPDLAKEEIYSDRLSPKLFANLLGRGVVGNIRGFILACNRFITADRIGIPDVTRCFLEMATDYYWPLMEEVAPKLGVYEPLVEPARNIIEAIVDNICRPLQKDRDRTIAQDRILVHRDIVSRYAKIFEILEYLGFLSKQEASKALKSGGRGPVFALNLCSILESIPTKRLTIEMINAWIEGQSDPSEIHISSSIFHDIVLPELSKEHSLSILSKNIRVLAKSSAYPYGLTEDMINRIESANITTVQELAEVDDLVLDQIYSIGEAKIRRIRDVIYQAIWM